MTAKGEPKQTPASSEETSGTPWARATPAASPGETAPPPEQRGSATLTLGCCRRPAKVGGSPKTLVRGSPVIKGKLESSVRQGAAPHTPRPPI